MAEILQPVSPTILPDNSSKIEILTYSGMYAGASEKLDQVIPVYRQRKRAAHSRIILSIIFINIVSIITPGSTGLVFFIYR